MLAAVPNRDSDRAACPACGGALTLWRSVGASEPALSGRSFELWRCPHCATAITGGPPEPGLHDSGAYRAGRPRLYRAARPLLGRFDAQRLRLLRALAPPGGRLLDAGAGQGRFVAAARAAGYDAYGIEPARRGIECSARRGVPVLPVSIESARVESASLDAVTLWHVLEHLDRPGEALTRIAAWLKPGGGLLVGIPNLASVQAQIGAERWFHLDVPRHRTHFTPAGITALLSRCGYTVLGVHHVLLEHNPFGMWQSLASRVTEHPAYLYNVLKRNAPLRSRDLAVTMLAAPLAPVAGLTELIAGMVGRGGTIAVQARRGG